MPKFTQAGRPIRVDTTLGDDVLLLQGFAGEEGVSQPFTFTLDMLSEDDAVTAEDVLRTAAVVHVELSGGDERIIHGLVSRFVQLERRGDLTAYRAEIVPWLWFLSLSSDCRIFQNLSVLEIVEQVFKDEGYSDFQLKCTKSYPKREFCVQYRETQFNFVSRLMEEEGIFYFFEHSEDKHVMILADSPSAVKPCPGQDTARMAVQAGAWQEEDVVTSLEREYAVQTTKVTIRDYDYLQPTLQLESSVAGNGNEEFYDYPGKFTALEQGDRYARLLLEQREAREERVLGVSTCRAFQPGYRFDLRGHYRKDANKTYQLLRIGHSARAPEYLATEQRGTFVYENEFLAMPHDVPYRPPLTSVKPVVQGTQPALVVGPPGEEVYVDKYGRVKVQFYWDRDGKKDEDSSCWVRVLTPWGGKGYGNVSVPRMGNEVIVSFIEGDPDRPIITGSVYNADQMPPYALPGAGIQMGMKSRSSPGGGGTNEITMTDTKGKEAINIHAQYDMTTTVEHDSTTTVNVDDTLTVKGKRTIDVTGKQTEHVKAAVAETYDDTQATTVNADITIKSKSGAITISADSGQVTVKAATKIQLAVGASTITMDAGGGIKIEGVNVAIKGSAAVGIKGAMVSSEADVQNSTKGALVISEGSATNTIKGGMVMLNP